MSIEAFTPPDPFVVAGIGPYEIGHPYRSNADFVVTAFDGENFVVLDAADWSISPDSGATSGDLSLTSGAATTHDGQTLYVVRRTLIEQGWVGLLGNREKGLEFQLDHLAMAVQDIRQHAEKSLSLVGSGDGIPVSLSAGRTLMASENGQAVVPGPTSDEISGAQSNAEAAQAALTEINEIAAVHKADTTISAMSANDSLAVGNIVTVKSAYNGQPETFEIVAPATHTANGTTVIDLTGISGQAVSRRSSFKTFAEFKADTRTHADGYYSHVIEHSQSYMAVSTGGDGVANDGGQAFKVLSGKDGSFNVKAFGAVADYNEATGAGTDDGPAFNLAVVAAKNAASGYVLVPYGKYLISTSIDVTNIYAGLILVGRAGYKISGAATGPMLFGNTGDGVPVIDFLGTQHGGLDGINVRSATNASSPSTVGVIFARSTTSQYAQFCYLQDSTVDIDSDPSANGGNGSVAVYNVAAEIFTLRDSYCLADTGFFFGSNNEFGVTSDYQTQGGPTSCSTVMIEGNTVLHSYNSVGTPLHLRAAAAVKGMAYCNAGGGGAGTHAFRMYGICKGLKLKIFPEFAHRIGLFPTTLEGCDIEILAGYDANKYIETPAGFSAMLDSDVTFTQTISGVFTAPDYWIAGESTDLAQNLTVIAPKEPAVAFVAPSNETYNLKNCSFQAGTDSLITRRSFKSRSSTYTDRPFRLGGFDLWVDDHSMMRRKSGAASSHDDGNPLGEMVAVPASASAAGAPGQWAQSSTYFYVYTGDGTTHSWARTAMATW